MGEIAVNIGDSNPLTVARGNETDIYPLNLPNLEVWYDGSDANMFSLSGVKVAQWNDKSGHSRHLYQAVDANRPDYDSVNDRVVFDRTAPEFLKSTDWVLNEPMTIYLKYQLLSEASIQHIFDIYGYVLERIMFYETALDARIKFAIVTSDTLGDYDTNEHVAGASIGESSSRVFLDDDFIDHANSSKLDGITLGARYSNTQGISGYIKQVLIYSLEHSDATIELMKTWLSGK